MYIRQKLFENVDFGELADYGTQIKSLTFDK